MKRIHKNLRKVLAIVLVCTMLTMSMGAYSGEVSDSVENNKIKLTQNSDGSFSENNEINLFNLKNAIYATKVENKEVIYTIGDNTMLQKVNESKYIVVEERKVKLMDLDMNSEVANLPKEIFDEVLSAKNEAVEKNDDVTCLMYYVTSGDNSYTEIPYWDGWYNGTRMRNYELYYVNKISGPTEIQGADLEELVSDIMSFIPLSSKAEAVYDLIGKGKSLLNIYKNLYPTITAESFDRSYLELNYDIYSKHTYVYNGYYDEFDLGVITRKVVLYEGIEAPDGVKPDGSSIRSIITGVLGGDVDTYEVLEGNVFYSDSYLNPYEIAYAHGFSAGFVTENVRGDIGELYVNFASPYYTRPSAWPDGVV